MKKSGSEKIFSFQWVLVMFSGRINVSDVSFNRTSVLGVAPPSISLYSYTSMEDNPILDKWGWGSQLIPVLNFGYFPQPIIDEINNITEEFLTMVGFNIILFSQSVMLSIAGFWNDKIKRFQQYYKPIEGNVTSATAIRTVLYCTMYYTAQYRRIQLILYLLVHCSEWDLAVYVFFFGTDWGNI